MSLSPSTLSSKRVKKNTKRVGRGNASGKGNYSARGMKGQRSRSGGKGGLMKRAFKAQLQKVPKLRGFTSPNPKAETVTLAVLEKVAVEGTEITPYFLKQQKVISSVKNGAKIVATGELKKKLTIKNCLATKKAVEAIEKAGGKIIF